jgi:predicted membrane protein
VSRSFKGGQLTAVMGGVEIDLRHAEVGEKPAVIEATAIMGGIEIKVPENWVVKDDTFAIFGAAEDKRSASVQVVDDSPDLVVTGVVFMGGLEIKD